MKLNNVTDVQKFVAAVNACSSDVYLRSQEGDQFNLKSSLSQYIAIGRLLEESGDSLELFALLSFVPIVLYSGRKATNSTVLQWGFYLFYPAHMMILWELKIGLP